MPEVSIAFQTNKSPSEYIKLAKLADSYQFDGISVYSDAPFHPGFAPLLLMAPYIKHARIGIAAVSPSRIHPIDIASQTALLSQLANNGVYMGFCRGGWLAECGITENHPPIQAIREAIEIVKQLLSGQAGGYNGQVYRIAGHIQAPYPLPLQKIPILIGTWGRKLCSVAGEIADEVKVGGSVNPDVVPIVRNYIEVGEKIAGRESGSVKVVVGAVCVTDEDRKLARLVARRSVALYLPIVVKLDPTLHVDNELILQLQYYANRQEYEEAGKLISDDLLDRFAFSGNPSDIIHQAEALFASGVHRIEFGTPHGLQSVTGIQLLGKRVLPVLKRCL